MDIEKKSKLSDFNPYLAISNWPPQPPRWCHPFKWNLTRVPECLKTKNLTNPSCDLWKQCHGRTNRWEMCHNSLVPGTCEPDTSPGVFMRVTTMQVQTWMLKQPGPATLASPVFSLSLKCDLSYVLFPPSLKCDLYFSFPLCVISTFHCLYEVWPVLFIPQSEVWPPVFCFLSVWSVTSTFHFLSLKCGLYCSFLLSLKCDLYCSFPLSLKCNLSYVQRNLSLVEHFSLSPKSCTLRIT